MTLFGSPNRGTQRRNQRVETNSVRGLSLRKMNLNELEEFSVVTFAYDAEKPGFPKRGLQPPNPNLYDANPLIVVTDIKRDKKLKLLMYGMNVNYVFSLVDRGKMIVAVRNEKNVNTQIYDRAIHCYRFDRIKSSLYSPRNLTLDPEILNSMGNWKLARDRKQFE